jgi:hypothetical protein
MASKTVTVGPGKTYASLQAAITGEVAANANLVTMNGVLNIELYAFTDTTPATVSGFTVDSTRFVNIYTAAEDRHAGVWDSAKYLISSTVDVIAVGCNYTRITGVQIASNAASDYGTSGCGVRISPSVGDVTIDNCIIKSTTTPTWHTVMYGVYSPYNGVGRNKVYNNIFYVVPSLASNYGFYLRGTNGSYLHNNTIVSASVGMYADIIASAKNNIFYNCTRTFDVSTVSGGYNSTNLAAWGANYTNQTGDRLSQTFSFVDAVNKDYRLTTSDTGAYQLGTDLSADAYLPFSTDITGTSRTTPWSIGAHQPVSGGGGTTYSADVNESTGISEQTYGATVASAPVSESEASTESVSPGAVATVGTAESVGETESAATTRTANVGAAESVGESEATATATQATVTASESEASTEALGTVSARVVGVVESSGSSASVGSVVVGAATVTESEGVSEQVSVPAGGSSVEESIGDTGGVATGARFSVALDEAGGVSEGVAAGGVQSASVSETVASTATAGAAAIASAGLEESEGVAGGVGAGVAATQGLGEAEAVSESAAGSIVGESTIYTADITETTVVVEYVTAPPIPANVVPVIQLLDPLEMVRVFAVEDVTPVRVRAMSQAS